MRPFAKLLVLVALPLLGAAGCGDDDGSPEPGTTPPAPGEPFKATIRRTSLGVPHIQAATLGDMGYGYGYAFAEDNLCLLMEEITTSRGERAKYFGDAPYDLGNTNSQSNVTSDAFYKMVATKEVVDKLRAANDADVQAAIRGFAAGVSRYVRELKGGRHAGRHATCANEPWAREITDEDLYLRYYKLGLIASSANFIDAIAAAQPPNASYAEPVAPKSLKNLGGLSSIAPKFMAQRSGDFGSNMYAFGSEVTGGGGIQFGNPHFPWFGGERLYQVHLTVPGRMDIQGASLYGIPFILIGFTNQFAWSHTVSTGYRFTPYRLALKEGDPLTYIQDGAEKKITPVDLQVEVKGEAAPRAVRLYRSEYGPMIYLGNSAFNWTLRQAFTIRDANAENFRLIKQFARWNQAKDFAEFKRVQEEEVAVPWVNTTAADKDGNAYYADFSVVPNVPDDLAQKCKVPLLSDALSDQAPGLPLLDGSRKECDWVVDPAAAQPGAFPASKLPRTERRDWVVNCNDSYWLTNHKEPITGYARIIGLQAYPQTLRSRLCHQQVLDRLAGQDGFAGTSFTANLVKQIVVGSRVYSAEKFKAGVLASVCTGAPVALTKDPLDDKDINQTVDIGAACTQLRAWDNRNNPDSRGAIVWDEFWLRVERLFINDINVRYATPFNPADPINTPRDLTTPPSVAQALAAAVYSVTSKGFAVDTPRSAVSWREGKGGPGDRIAIPGGFQRTGNFAIAQVPSPVLKPDVGYSPMLYGNSYMQVVAFGPNGVDASTFVTYGQSTDKANEHYDDYTRRYAAKDWLKAAFTEAEIAADTKSTLEIQQ